MLTENDAGSRRFFSLALTSLVPRLSVGRKNRKKLMERSKSGMFLSPHKNTHQGLTISRHDFNTKNAILQFE
jgi:hypothetical protein